MQTSRNRTHQPRGGTIAKGHTQAGNKLNLPKPVLHSSDAINRVATVQSYLFGQLPPALNNFKTHKPARSFIIALTGFLLFATTGIKQVNAQGLGLNNPTPHASAILDLVATNRGLLVPRMTTSQRTGISSPATSLLVYDTDNNYYYFYTGTYWEVVGDATTFWTQTGNYLYNTVDSIGIGTATPSNLFTVAGNADFTDSVGIGTTNPGQKLEVNGGILTSGRISVQGQATGQAGGLEISYDPVTERGGLESLNLARTAYKECGLAGDPVVFWTGTGLSITKRMIIDNTGKVGIGTTSPARLLHVAADKDATPDSLLVVDAGGKVGIGTTSPEEYLEIARGTGDTPGILLRRGTTSDAFTDWRVQNTLGDLQFSSRGSSGTWVEKVRFKWTGRVGIGTNYPSAVLTIEKSAVSDTLLYVTNDADATKDSVFIVTASGDVGIGTSIPSEKLEVDGTVEMTGFKLTTAPTEGYVLTSDGTGIGTWAAPTTTTTAEGLAPSTLPTSLDYIGPTVSVTITAGQDIHVVAQQALGAAGPGIATDLHLNVCYDDDGVPPLTEVGLGMDGLELQSVARLPFGVTAVIEGLAPGTYTVGMCGVSSDGADWNSNGQGKVSVIVATN